MKLPKLILASILASGLSALTTQQAYALNLPICELPVNCLTFGDFNVYSLPLLDLQAGGDGVPKPGDSFYAPATYGAIQNNTIIGINNGNSTQTGNPSTTTDGSFNTPSQNNTTNQIFSTATAPDPNGGPAIGDGRSWDSTVGALQTLIGGANNPLVAFFAFNETGSGTGLLTTDLLIWAKVTLYDYTETGDILNSKSFYLSGNGSTDTPDETHLPDTANATQDTVGPWVYVHAGICVSDAGQFVGFPTNGVCASGTVKNQNNLGQNAAAFAINSPDLDTAMQSGDYNVFSLDWKMAYINGGGETAWFMPAGVDAQCPPGSTDPICLPINVPEPLSLSLLGIGLLGLGASRRFIKPRRA
ncbi:MAG: hypothetical protein CVU16_06755 [Betaproteobacteria bacterium HGW-Betaproteobacteria-10]|nr:MAG: hypothetical protein CVU16_06755 [Betaproteobacteria bacterium HGW-Betaproteobacteria-10]